VIQVAMGGILARDARCVEHRVRIILTKHVIWERQDNIKANRTERGDDLNWIVVFRTRSSIGLLWTQQQTSGIC